MDLIIRALDAGSPGSRAVEVVERKGRAVSDPLVADARLGGDQPGVSSPAVRRVVSESVRAELSGFAALRDALLTEHIPVF